MGCRRALSSQRRARTRVSIGFGLHPRRQRRNGGKSAIQENHGDNEPSRSMFNLDVKVIGARWLTGHGMIECRFRNRSPLADRTPATERAEGGEWQRRTLARRAAQDPAFLRALSAERWQLQECGAGEGHVNVGLNVVRSGDNEPPPNGREETEILMGISPHLLCQMDSWS